MSVSRSVLSPSALLVAVLAAAFLCLPSTTLFAADTEKVLASFSGLNGDGANPQGVVFDSKGNLYGTTQGGGSSNCIAIKGCGTVFRLSPDANGKWHKTILHHFTDADGEYPSAGLVQDAAGNLYGTTSWGANSNCVLPLTEFVGCGDVFELSPTAQGGWTFKVIHRFNGQDGANPSSPLIADSAGNLYGTTTGASTGVGTVFELQPGTNGSWVFRTVHVFAGTDGFSPTGNLAFDTAGNLYGTTEKGGTSDTGTVYELSPTGSGGWTETALYSFGSSGGTEPTQGVITDSAGNLYGTTVASGGLCGCNYGTVFELTRGSGGEWTRTTLHTFATNDGHSPQGLIFDAAGNLYGLAFVGGGSSNDGSVFELSRGSNGKWTETPLHVFRGTDGAGPVDSLIFDASGNLYGASAYGGAVNNEGAIFELSVAK